MCYVAVAATYVNTFMTIEKSCIWGEVLMIDKAPPPKGKLRKKLRVFGVQTIVSAAKVNLGLVQDVRLLR
jgi:hypothetical protein